MPVPSVLAATTRPLLPSNPARALPFLLQSVPDPTRAGRPWRLGLAAPPSSPSPSSSLPPPASKVMPLATQPHHPTFSLNLPHFIPCAAPPGIPLPGIPRRSAGRSVRFFPFAGRKRALIVRCRVVPQQIGSRPEFGRIPAPNLVL